MDFVPAHSPEVVVQGVFDVIDFALYDSQATREAWVGESAAEVAGRIKSVTVVGEPAVQRSGRGGRKVTLRCSRVAATYQDSPLLLNVRVAWSAAEAVATSRTAAKSFILARVARPWTTWTLKCSEVLIRS